MTPLNPLPPIFFLFPAFQTRKTTSSYSAIYIISCTLYSLAFSTYLPLKKILHVGIPVECVSALRFAVHRREHETPLKSAKAIMWPTRRKQGMKGGRKARGQEGRTEDREKNKMEGTKKTMEKKRGRGDRP
jgi:hypothetical protein